MGTRMRRVGEYLGLVDEDGGKPRPDYRFLVVYLVVMVVSVGVLDLSWLAFVPVGIATCLVWGVAVNLVPGLRPTED